MKRISIAVTILILGLICLLHSAECNLERALVVASTKETDGEIQQVLYDHGFRIGIYDEITPQEKIKALFR